MSHPIYDHIIFKNQKEFSARDSFILDYRKDLKWQGIDSVDDKGQTAIFETLKFKHKGYTRKTKVVPYL